MKFRITKRNSLDKLVLVSMAAANVLFLVYWGVLAFYSRLNNDDLHFLWMVRDMSLFGFVKDMYMTTSGRWVGYFVNGLVSEVVYVVGFHQLWMLVYYILGLGCCWLFVNDLDFRVSRVGLFFGTCFIYNLYILTNIDFPLCFWLCAMSYYLYFPMALLLLKYLNLVSLKKWQKLLLVLLVLLVGGMNETFTPMVLLLMLVCGLYWWRSKGWKVKETWALPQVRRIVWTALALIVLLAIVVAAPGNYVRLEEGMAEGEGFVHPSGLIDWIVSLLKTMLMFFYFMVFYIPYALVAFALAYYVGTKSEKTLKVSKSAILLTMLVGFLVYLAFACLPDVYLYRGFRLQRNYTHVVFLWWLLVFAAGYVCGCNRKSLLSGKCAFVGVLAMMVVAGVNIFNDAPTAKKFGKAVDERVEYLCTLRDRGQKETVTVKPLPIPYTEDVKHFVLNGLLGKDTPMTSLYYFSEAQPNVPNVYSKDLKMALGLGFDFVLESEEGLSN